MSIQSITSKGKNAKREWILAKATEIFFEKGYDSVSVEEIAEHAEVSKGSVYTYFKSKAELHMAIYLVALELLNQRMALVFSKSINGLDMLHELGKQYIRFAKEEHGYFTVMQYFKQRQHVESVQNEELLNACQQSGFSVFNYILRAIQIGKQDGSIRPDIDSKSMALQIWSGTSGLSDLFYSGTHFEKAFNQGITGEEITMPMILAHFMDTISRAIATNYSPNTEFTSN